MGQIPKFFGDGSLSVDLPRLAIGLIISGDLDSMGTDPGQNKVSGLAI